METSAPGFFGNSGNGRKWMEGDELTMARKDCCSGYSENISEYSEYIKEVIGQPISELETPALMVDLDIMEANMEKMMAFLKKSGAGVGIRPHAKTHKTPQIALAQMAKGALGICCAKVGEAEAMAEGGLPDILIANQVVGHRKIKRLAALSKKTNLKVAVDTKENLQDISRESAKQGGKVGIVIEVEVGNKRGGVRTVEEAVEIAKLASTLPGVWYAGVMGYEGFAVFMPDFEARKAAANGAYDILLSFRDAIEEKAGLDSEIVSAAGTGTFQFAGRRQGLTDIEAGSFIFMDVRYGDTAGVGFRHSLAVVATITSHPEPDLYICDAGLKSMSREFGIISTLPSYGVKVSNMSEEHVSLRPSDNPHQLPGFKELNDKYAKPAKPLGIGDKVLLIPSHCCTTVNLHDIIYAVRNGKIEDVWKVTGRGRFV
ncbi:MAG TPA: DSD1 family PLP-dependent enzyme [Firmicutes bacterium]|nr:DSD1 family PLP-dependent enzyme [Candidatus Fermentithermobacillaceae bacterium]